MMAGEHIKKVANGWKLTSRKFLVWFFSSCILVWLLVKSDIELTNSFIPWWGSISLLYIGGNVAQKAFLEKQSDR